MCSTDVPICLNSNLKIEKVRYHIRFFLILLGVSLLIFTNANFAQAHLIGSDVITKKVGDYEVRFVPYPRSPNPGEPTILNFSVLDLEGNNVFNIEANVKILKDDVNIFTSPKVRYEFSDFSIQYVFPEKGNYHIVLEVAIQNESNISADFTITVSQPVNVSQSNVIVAITAIVIAVVIIVILKKSNITKHMHN